MNRPRKSEPSSNLCARLELGEMTTPSGDTAPRGASDHRRSQPASLRSNKKTACRRLLTSRTRRAAARNDTSYFTASDRMLAPPKLLLSTSSAKLFGGISSSAATKSQSRSSSRSTASWREAERAKRLRSATSTFWASIKRMWPNLVRARKTLPLPRCRRIDSYAIADSVGREETISRHLDETDLRPDVSRQIKDVNRHRLEPCLYVSEPLCQSTPERDLGTQRTPSGAN